jgi:Tol biopolymer transport system component
MYVSTPRTRPAGLVLVLVLLHAANIASAQGDGNVLFLSEYLHGDYYVAPLGDVDEASPGLIQPRQLRLPWWFRRGVELGNHDVSPDGRYIVFAARTTDDYDWDIYGGRIDVNRRLIRGVQRIIGNDGEREEDPRVSWDGTQVVYKCDGNICIYPNYIYTNPVVASWCELWAPSMDRSGYVISYTKRCGDAADDKIWYYNLLTGTESQVPGIYGSADRFGHYLDDGRIVYSHIDSTQSRSSLWIAEAGFASLLHDRTDSDDDPYPDKHDPNHIAFIGWEGDGYNLFIYRRDQGDSVRLTQGIPILSPVLFRQ